MKRRLEIEISEDLYIKLKEQSKKENSTVEEYIAYKIKETENYKYQLDTLKKTAVYGLQNLLYKLKTIDTTPDKKTYKNVKITSLVSYKNPLSKTLSEVVDAFKEQQDFNKESFYLLTDENKVVGYIGIDFHEEPMPYGVYGFIYVFNLSKSYHKKDVLTGIIRFLDNLLKEKRVYNLDIASNSSNLSQEQLKQLGFLELSEVYKGKVKIKNNILKDSSLKEHKIQNIKMEDLDIKTLNQYISAARIFPMTYLYDRAIGKKKIIKIEKFIYNEPQRTVFILKELIDLNDKKLYRYVILMEPISIYDKEILEEVYSDLIKYISKQEENTNIALEFPVEIKEYLGKYMEHTAFKKIFWYRKVIS
ncbi:MAG: GNAT family N-acetyltransferase [Clostridiaceae bacterium]|nr:GNAT family N-acetyltransferase [Clostridiaceae bacterium]